MKNKGTFRKDNMKKGIYILPNLFTSAGLFSGFYSIISSMQERYDVAAIAILVAAVLDALDGRIARMTNTSSKFGAEYDSLADVIAFGVAPGILAYTWSLSTFGKWGWAVAFLFVACGALRLARFNIQIGIVESKVFNGLPIPGAACVLATSVLLFYKMGGEGRFDHLSVIIGVFCLALLMVSSVKFYSFKDLNYFARKPFMSLVAIILIMILVYVEPEIMIFTFVAGYSLSGPLWSVYKLLRRTAAQDAEGKTTKKFEIL